MERFIFTRFILEQTSIISTESNNTQTFIAELSNSKSIWLRDKAKVLQHKAHVIHLFVLFPWKKNIYIYVRTSNIFVFA